MVVIAAWDAPAAYTAWQNFLERLKFARGLAPFFDSVGSADTRRFRVVHAHVPAV